MKTRAFTLVEIIIAFALLIFGIVTFLSVFTSSAHLATQSRNRTVATIQAENILEEIEAHPYGSPAPQSWDEETVRPVELWLGGRESVIEISQKVEYENGSFVGNANGDFDLVTVTLTWKETMGDTDNPDPVAGATQDNKSLKVQVPVWR